MAEPITVGDGRTSESRRVVVLAGIAAAVLLALVVLPGLLFSDGDTPSDDAFPPPPAGATSTTVPGIAPSETFEPFTSKDPFAPLVDLGSASPSTDVGESTPVTSVPDDVLTDSPTFEDDLSPTTDTDPTFADSDDVATDEPPPPPPRQPDRVSLLEVFTDAGGQVVASVRVNDVTYQVAEGDDFATSYRVLDLDIGTRCGQFLFGDDRFGLCEDEEVLK